VICITRIHGQAIHTVRWWGTCFRIFRHLRANLGIYIVPCVWSTVREESRAYANYWPVCLMKFGILVGNISLEHMESARQVTDGPKLWAGIC
jgi:hypothetical protein